MDITITEQTLWGWDWPVLFSALAAAGTVATAVVALVQLTALRREARIGRRPFIAIEHAEYRATESLTTLQVRLANDGLGPAIDVLVGADLLDEDSSLLVHMHAEPEPPPRWRRAARRRLNDSPESAHEYGSSILYIRPDGAAETFTIYQVPWLQNREHHSVVIYVEYLDAYDTLYRQTRVVPRQ